MEKNFLLVMSRSRSFLDRSIIDHDRKYNQNVEIDFSIVQYERQ
jgi:hypothetical protein